MSDGLRIFLVLLLVLGNGWFVVAEYALITARRARLSELARKHRRGAATALRLMEEPVRFISTVQIGITILSILLGAIGEPLISFFFEPYISETLSFLIAFSILTYLGLVVGELVPKAVALQHAERIAMIVAVPVDVLQRLAHPLVVLLQGSAKGILRLFGMKSARVGMVVRSEEEIRSMLAEAEETGLIEEAEEEMIYKVFDFADKEVHDVMVPRPEVVGVSVELPAEECLDTERLARDLVQRGRAALAPGSNEGVLELLLAKAAPGDVVALLSNGDFGGVSLKERLVEGLATRPGTEA